MKKGQLSNAVLPERSRIAAKKAWRQWNVGIVYPKNTSSKRPLKQQDRETQHI